MKAVSAYMPRRTPLYPEIGERIRRERELKGLTQTEFAELLGISTSTLVNFEVGRFDWPLSRLADVCRILRCTADVLVDGDIP
jgi:transcriptional regulator with XRE-family HTH domain